MPVTFKDFQGKTKSLRVVWDDVEVNITYSPSANTAGMAIALQDDLEGDPAANAKQAVQVLQKLLVGWDIMLEPNGYDKAHMQPSTEEFLLALPIPFLSAILTQIGEDQSPKGKKSAR